MSLLHVRVVTNRSVVVSSLTLLTKYSNFRCRNCKYRTYDVQHLNRHMKVKHPSVRNTVVKVFECPMCEYVTSTEFQYKRHLRVIFFTSVLAKFVFYS